MESSESKFLKAKTIINPNNTNTTQNCMNLPNKIKKKTLNKKKARSVVEKIVHREIGVMKMKTALLGNILDFKSQKYIELTETSQYLSYHNKMYFSS